MKLKRKSVFYIYVDTRHAQQIDLFYTKIIIKHHTTNTTNFMGTASSVRRLNLFYSKIDWEFVTFIHLISLFILLIHGCLTGISMFLNKRVVLLFTVPLFWNAHQILVVVCFNWIFIRKIIRSSNIWNSNIPIMRHKRAFHSFTLLCTKKYYITRMMTNNFFAARVKVSQISFFSFTSRYMRT